MKNESANLEGNTDSTMNNAPVKSRMDTASGMNTTPSNSAPAQKPGANAAMKNKSKGKWTVGKIQTKASMSSMKPDKNGVYESTDVQPMYPGGSDALQAYINQNIQYPQTAIDNNAAGTVDVQFVVDENGKVRDVKTMGGNSDKDLSAEATRVVSKMSQWTPGKVKGKNVKTRVVLPITYQLEQ
jgi:TonB family protein